MQHFSKSKLLAFRQCPKRFWLEVHRPDIREDSDATQSKFLIGYQVGEIAQKLYDPYGNGALINANEEGYDEAFARSEELLTDSPYPVFEAGFKANGALAFADVMLPELDNGQMAWKMIEVKSSTTVKDYHRDDVAVQTFVAKSAGVKLKAVILAHIDNSFIYPGDGDYRGLLKENDLTEEVFARNDEVKGWIAGAQVIAAQTVEPTMETGGHCYQPFECGFCTYCNQGVARPEYPIDWLPRFSASQRERLTAQGVDDLRGVPNDLLNHRQLRVKEHTLTNTIYFDAAGAAADLAPHGFPAYFLDFETAMMAVPIWKGTRPYQQIPFQFSLHILTESGDLEHRSFLDLSGDDPSEPFAKSLIAACGKSGPVFVYNAGFEKTRILELGERFSSMNKRLKEIHDRIVDLLPIARERYYHPNQQGSWSIKAVLPSAVPELSYNDLEGVKDGGTAMEVFSEAIQPGTSQERKTEIERQLLAYCQLDTLAMVRLWQFFSGRNMSSLPTRPKHSTSSST